MATGKPQGSGLYVKQDSAALSTAVSTTTIYPARALVGALLVEPCLCGEGDQGHRQVIRQRLASPRAQAQSNPFSRSFDHRICSTEALSSPFSLIGACVVKSIGVLALRGESIGTGCYRQHPHLSQFLCPRRASKGHLTAIAEPHGSSRIQPIRPQSR